MLAQVRGWLLLLAACTTVSTTRAADYSELEQRTLAAVLGDHAELDARAEGKRIERIDIVSRPVFDEEDPVPDFLNALHMQTRERILRRELLFREGMPFSAEQVRDTERNLRVRTQLSVVLIVAVRGSTPDAVRVVVIARDVWSFRPNSTFQLSDRGLGYLALELSEENFLGLHTTVGALFTLQPDRYSFGGVVDFPRIAGSALDGHAYGGVYVNRDDGALEGSFGLVRLAQLLLSRTDDWGYVAGAAWVNEQTRLYRDFDPLLYRGIPVEYHSSVVRAGAQVTRALARAQRRELTFGIEFQRRNYEAQPSADVTPEAFADFVEQELPVSNTRLSPFVQFESSTREFLNTRDIETLALQESFRLGPYAALRFYPALRGAGSTRDLLGVMSWAGYTLQMGDGFARILLQSTVEAADERRNFAAYQGGARWVTPRFGVGRFVLDVVAVDTYRNFLNRKLVFGGELRPRGYAEGALRGASGYAGTLEFRSTSVNVLSARVGVAAFYDVGGAGERLADSEVSPSLGAGFRVLFPQANRDVLRLDWAVPLAGSGLPGHFVVTFRQAFDALIPILPDVTANSATLLPQSK